MSAFKKGTRCLLLSRLQAGMYCHEFYVARLVAGGTDRLGLINRQRRHYLRQMRQPEDGCKTIELCIVGNSDDYGIVAGLEHLVWNNARVIISAALRNLPTDQIACGLRR